jgi:hypothetical protein
METPEIQEIEEAGTMTPEIFFGALVTAVSIGHIKHLQMQGEGSFAGHLAMLEFYKGAIKIADAVIETYQGYKKEIVEYDCEAFCDCVKKEVTALDYLNMLRETIQDYRYDIIPKKESHIHNELDNMVTLIDGVVYKLTFLK